MSQQRYMTVNFGTSRAGLATVGYTIYDKTNTQITARTTTNITEIGQGQYGTNTTIPDDFSGYIIWDSGQTTPAIASEEINPLLTPALIAEIVNDTTFQASLTNGIIAAINAVHIDVHPEKTVVVHRNPTVAMPHITR